MITLCKYCKQPTQAYPPDGIDVCEDHGVVEGDTMKVTEQEYEDFYQ